MSGEFQRKLMFIEDFQYDSPPIWTNPKNFKTLKNNVMKITKSPPEHSSARDVEQCFVAGRRTMLVYPEIVLIWKWTQNVKQNHCHNWRRIWEEINFSKVSIVKNPGLMIPESSGRSTARTRRRSPGWRQGFRNMSTSPVKTWTGLSIPWCEIKN